MNVPQFNRTLVSAIGNAGPNSGDRFLSGAGKTVYLNDLIRGSSLGGRGEELRNRSVVLATRDQISAAMALIELDGLAKRIVLCPADLPSEQLPAVISSVSADAIVSDRRGAGEELPPVLHVENSPEIVSAEYHRNEACRTEWILLTSGTTGRPKMVAHTLTSLAGAIDSTGIPAPAIVWSTFYDIRRYGGLQIFLRAVLAGGSLVLTGAGESTAAFLERAGRRGVTHISGTPSHWRGALMNPAARMIAPRYVRLSGEVADQSILDRLRSFYVESEVVHAFASTEAGLAFEVCDGLAGFPASVVRRPAGGAEIEVIDGSLRVRSERNAVRYLGQQDGKIAAADGFVDTGDMVELRGDRYYFAGRRDGVINVGGLKIHPEEVEAVINRYPGVRGSLVWARKNPITGALVVADVVLETATYGSDAVIIGQSGGPDHEILQLCRGALPRHKVPSAIRFVSYLPVAATGKVMRNPCGTLL